MDNERVWLYELDASYWKQFVHERFLTPTFDEQNMLRRGSLSLFNTHGSQTHNTFANHIVAEELVSEFREGKGVKTFWNRKHENNHWLDAVAMASAAGAACGIKLVGESEVEIKPVAAEARRPAQRPAQQHGRFKRRDGGWIPRRRNG
jgi:hypothetical protein